MRVVQNFVGPLASDSEITQIAGMTCTVPPTTDRTPSASSPPPPESIPWRDVGPALADSANSRPRRRFPAPHTEAVRWAGADPRLEQIVRDHAAAVGADAVTGSAPDTCAVTVLDAAALEQHQEARLHELAAHGEPLIVVVPDGAADVAVLRRAIRAGVQAVVELPSQSAELLDRLATILRPTRVTDMIAVVGGCGGAGASSFAARLAGAARVRGDVVLVDADPLGGGLDALVESPPNHGATWSDIASIDTADGTALRGALPRVDDVALLGAGTGPGADAISLGRALTALEPGGGTVITDLAPGLVAAARPHVHRLLVVVPASAHAVRAAARRLDAWGSAAADAQLVVRRSGELSVRDVADLLGLPVIASFRDSAPGAVPLLDRRRGGADAACRRLMQQEKRP